MSNGSVISMKNDLTRVEWLALASFLENPHKPFVITGELEADEHKYKDYKSAKTKFINAAKEMRD